MDRTSPNPNTLESLHALAEHVVAAALYAETGRIGLRVAPGGFSTPPFAADRRTVGVDHVDLVDASAEGTRRAYLSTLDAAAQLAGVAPGAPASVYTPATVCDPDAPLDIDPVSADAVAQWHALGDDALRRWASVLDPTTPASATLWPEHFDVAIGMDSVTYGASPGDHDIADPYLYVGTPSDRRSSDRFWNAPFGAACSWEAISDAPDAVRFFQSGHRHLKP
jgi:hypothetical protein